MASVGSDRHIIRRFGQCCLPIAERNHSDYHCSPGGSANANNPTGKKRGWRGTTPFEEYIADFSTYKDVGKFHFRYWARKGEKFKVQAKVQDIDVVGTGQWETVIIKPLHKELHTHHILMAFQNLNDGPAELNLDDAFYYKGDLPAALIRARDARRPDEAPAKKATK